MESLKHFEKGSGPSLLFKKTVFSEQLEINRKRHGIISSIGTVPSLRRLMDIALGRGRRMTSGPGTEVLDSASGTGISCLQQVAPRMRHRILDQLRALKSCEAIRDILHDPVPSAGVAPSQFR
ncbi:hypothetical protein DL765_010344 [Monosporascus sp. GIB2]|nr:hypothetical protein DL765_010344 [Monosporascus sp. GIB2]